MKKKKSKSKKKKLTKKGKSKQLPTAGGGAEPPVIMAEQQLDLNSLNNKIDLLARIILTDSNPATREPSHRRNRKPWGIKTLVEINEKSPEWLPFLFEYSMRIYQLKKRIGPFPHGGGPFPREYMEMMGRAEENPEEFHEDPFKFLHYIYKVELPDPSDPFKDI